MMPAEGFYSKKIGEDRYEYGLLVPDAFYKFILGLAPEIARFASSDIKSRRKTLGEKPTIQGAHAAAEQAWKESN